MYPQHVQSLLHGDAGGVVETFGTFVVGGNILVGIVVFLILIIINLSSLQKVQSVFPKLLQDLH